MNPTAFRNQGRPSRSADVIDLADYIRKLEPPAGYDATWSRYSAQETILKVLAELRRERRTLAKATRTLERLANMRGRSSRRNPRLLALSRG